MRFCLSLSHWNVGCASQGKRQVGTWGWQETQAHTTADVKRNCRSVNLISLQEKKTMSFDGEYAVLSDLEAVLYLCITNMFPVTLGCRELPCIQVSEHRAMQRKGEENRWEGAPPYDWSGFQAPSDCKEQHNSSTCVPAWSTIKVPEARRLLKKIAA